MAFDKQIAESNKRSLSESEFKTELKNIYDRAFQPVSEKIDKLIELKERRSREWDLIKKM